MHIRLEANSRDVDLHMVVQLSPEVLRNNRCRYHEAVLRVENVGVRRRSRLCGSGGLWMMKVEASLQLSLAHPVVGL